MIPNAQESQDFWSHIWSKEENHDLYVDRPKDLKESESHPQQEQVQITKEKVCAHSRKLVNWKAAGQDGVQGYWIKKLTECHERIAEQLDSVLGDEGEISGWMRYGKTVLCLKDPGKGNAVDHYRPISSLRLMWKLLTGILANEMRDFLDKNNIFPGGTKRVQEEE